MPQILKLPRHNRIAASFQKPPRSHVTQFRSTHVHRTPASFQVLHYAVPGAASCIVCLCNKNFLPHCMDQPVSRIRPLHRKRLIVSELTDQQQSACFQLCMQPPHSPFQGIRQKQNRVAAAGHGAVKPFAVGSDRTARHICIILFRRNTPKLPVQTASPAPEADEIPPEIRIPFPAG